ncbi:ORC-CDC6 family AAA ATPase [Vibrio harveyi]
MEKKLSDVVSKNRAEEFPDDLWGQYVLPLEYEAANLHKLTKGAVIEGGRGSGKTMFLKYHCHETMFSQLRTKLPDDITNHIGIYWKPDTSFTQMIRDEWLDETWSSAFNTYASLCVLIEFCKLCNSIATSNLSNKRIKDGIKKVRLPKVLAEDINVEHMELISLEPEIKSCLYRLTNWINLPNTTNPPYNLALKPVISLVSDAIRSVDDELKDTTFHILIDEFENLSFDQQKIINTYLKHSEKSLIFSIAYKKNAKVSNETLSQEKIVDRNDFRRIDLESIYLNDLNPKSYEVLAAEILALKLFEANCSSSSENDEIIQNYSNPDFLTIRKDTTYQTRLRNSVKSLFESMNLTEVSKLILSDKVLLNKLKSTLILEGLKKHKDHSFSEFDFIDEKYPEASIVNGAILNRSSTDLVTLKKDFETYKSGSNDTPYKGWISNNLYGVILYIYNTLPQRECPLYVGFNQFILMSRGNLRHFLELCYQTFIRAEVQSELTEASSAINVDIQGKATKATSTAQLEKIEELGSNGIHLKRLAKRLGSLFSLSQKRKSQSESEVNHFTIALSDISLLNDDTKKLLNEALVWSVLFQARGTKAKSNNDIEMIDYILHPVLSCHFGISPRKKRKLKFNVEQIETICYGNESDFSELKNKFNKQWGLESKKSEDNESGNNSGQYSLL